MIKLLFIDAMFRNKPSVLEDDDHRDWLLILNYYIYKLSYSEGYLGPMTYDYDFLVYLYNFSNKIELK